LNDYIVLFISILILIVPKAGANRGRTGIITYFLIFYTNVYIKAIVPSNLTFTMLIAGYCCYTLLWDYPFYSGG
jgi:hypothetical protein